LIILGYFEFYALLIALRQAFVNDGAGPDDRHSNPPGGDHGSVEQKRSI
jgi:hypothetical protein